MLPRRGALQCSESGRQGSMNLYQPYNTDHWVRRSSRSWSTRTQGARILSEETTRAPEVDESEETTHDYRRLDDDGLTPELRVFWSRREFGVGDTVALAPGRFARAWSQEAQ